MERRILVIGRRIRKKQWGKEEAREKKRGKIRKRERVGRVIGETLRAKAELGIKKLTC